ncbi:hypothetical protein [uncultured Oceanisphaera sp.]|uniref:hypothetical protein n=1 Tax=uncultured Oceanisphaera sp. TaxID=353858 RepID=UPI00260BCAFC|nr:hypothetical protein [uncultured Oceanisphaera sp.]
MATWDTSDLGKETCDQCGTIYSVTGKQYPCRDKDSFTCSCGNKIRSWNGTMSYSYTPIKDEKITE